MEDIKEEMLEKIEELSNIEIQEKQIKYAIFNRKMQEAYNEKIKIIADDFDRQSESFGKHLEKYIKEKTRIIEKSGKEFRKIYEKRKEQFCGIEAEIEEIELNQKMILNNIEKIYISRSEVIKEENCNVQERVKQSEIVISALIDKYEKYDELIRGCESKIEECIDSLNKDFESIIKNKEEALIVPEKENIFKKLFGIFISKNKKNKKEIIGKIENRIDKIQSSNEIILEEIEKQTISIIAKIEEIKANINLEFKAAIE